MRVRFSILPSLSWMVMAVCLFTSGTAWGQFSIVPQINTVAGNSPNGNPGYSGDGGPATAAYLRRPAGVAMDAAGNLYIADTNNNVVRKITASTGVISTVAGNGTQGFTGDGGTATAAELNRPQGVSVDAAGNLYIADTSNYVIRKVTASTGVISTVAGNNTQGYTGDGGPATAAELNAPSGVSVDAAGNLYIADTSNNVIRKVTVSTGVISTVAGNGTRGYTGDGSTATAAELYTPQGVAVDSAGNIYIADYNNGRIRKVTVSTGVISTVAGNGTGGYTGDGGQATAAELNQPRGVAVDSAGNFYIADYGAMVIRKVTASTGVISTVAGNGTGGFTGDGGQAIAAELNNPEGVAVDAAGNVYIADWRNNAIREVTALAIFPGTATGSSITQNVLVTAGSAYNIVSVTAPVSQGNQQEFTVGTVTGCTVDASGSTTTPAATVCTVPVTFTPAYPGQRAVPLQFGVKSGSTTVTYSVGMDGTGIGPLAVLTPRIISTVAGNGTGGYTGNGGTATAAELYLPRSTALDTAGNLYIADYNNNVVRKVTASTGVISTVAGNGTAGYTGDGGTATAAELNNPSGVALDAAGNLYITDYRNNVVRKVAPSTGIISTVVGNGTAGYTGDGGQATAAQLFHPDCVPLDAAGNLYIADFGNNAIRKVTPSTGMISTVAGNGTAGFTGDGGPATSAELNGPGCVALDAAGNLYIADYTNNRIRKVIASTGVISTMAGNGTAGYLGDGGPATSAELYRPAGVTLDPAGNLYIADFSNGAIRKVTASTGVISTVAGTGTAGYSGDGGSATLAQLGGPAGVALDAAGNLYIADFAGNRIRKVNTAQGALSWPTPTTYGITDSSDGPQTATLENIGNASLTFNVPGSGMNPSVSANFQWSNGSTCPQLGVSSSAQTLAAGVSCSLILNFVPAAVGSITGQAIVSDNSSSTTQQILTLTGTGTTAPLTVTASSTSVPYGSTVPTVTPSYSGWVGSDSPSVLTTAPTCSTSYTTTSPVSGSPYATTCSGAAAANYTMTYVPGSLTVTKANPTVSSWPTTSSITYGQTLASSTLSGGTASVAGSYAWSSPSTKPSSGSSSQSLTFTPTDTADYNTVTSTVTVTVAPAPLTVTASSTSVPYGSTVPTITPSYSGWVGSDSPSVLTTAPTCSTSYTTTSSVSGSPYATTCSGAAAANYTMTYIPGSVTVTKANPTVSQWPTASSVIYGQTLASSTLSGGTASVGGAYAWTTPSTKPSTGSSSQSVTFTPTDTADYNTVTSTVTVTVVKAPLTVTASSTSVPYGSTVPTITPSYSGWVGSDSPSVLTTAPTCSTTYTATSSVSGSPYASTCSGAAAANYTMTYVPGSVSVTKANPTVSQWPTASSVIYGQTLASSTLSGGTASVGGSYAWTTPSTTPSSGSSSQSVTFTPTDTADYNTVTSTVTVTVAKAPLTITASSTSVPYGSTVPTVTPSYSGWVGSDSPSVLTTAPTCSTSYTATSPVSGSPYATTCSGAAAANYTMTYVPGSLTVTKANPTVSSWPTTSSITYGQTLASSTLTGGTASVAGSYAWTTPSTKPSSGSSSQSVTFTPTDTADYNTVTSTVTVTVAQAPLTVTASSTSVPYGSTVPTITPSYSGWVGSDSPSVLTTAPTCSTTYTTTSPVSGSPYATTCSGAAAANYTMTYIPGSVTVTKANPTVSSWPTTSSITYGQTLASSTLTGGTASVAGSYAWSSPSTKPSSGSSSQSVTFTPTDTTDYNTVISTVTVTVAPAPLTVTASSTSVAYGSAVPTITPSYSGWVGSDSPSVLTTAPTCSTSYTATSSVSGSPYATTCSGAAATNYTITYVPGSVTVTKANPTVSQWPTTSSITYGQTLASSTLTGGTASVAGSYAWTTPSTKPSSGGSSQSITFTPTDTADYNTVTSTVTVTVAKATVTITAATSLNPSIYGDTLTFTFHFTGVAGMAVPTGTASISVDGTTVATSSTLDGTGSVTYTTPYSSPLVTGTHKITTAYGGDGNYATASSTQ